MKSFVLALLCSLLAVSASAKDVAFIIVSSDRNVSHELLADATEAIAFQVSDQRGITFIPKERFVDMLKYESADKHGPCFYDAPSRHVSHACVYEVVRAADVEKAVVLMVEPKNREHMFVMHVVHADQNRQPEVYTSPYAVNVSRTELLISAAYIFSVNAFGAENTKAPVARLKREAEQDMRRNKRASEPYTMPAAIIQRSDDMYMWSAIGTGAAALAFTTAAIVIGVQAHDLESQYDACVDAPCAPGMAEGYAKDGMYKTDMANAMIGVASACAIGTAILTVLAMSEHDRETIPSITITPTSNGTQMMMSLTF